MASRNPGCFGHYDFDHIAHFAKLRFVDGYSTITLLQQARSETEREEAALVCMLDLEDNLVLNVELDCRYANDCKITNCRDKLRKLIEAELKSRVRNH
jgi:hypothetical protein